MEDIRGVIRLHCKSCGVDECSAYLRPTIGNNCDYCGCAPVKHEKGHCTAATSSSDISHNVKLDDENSFEVLKIKLELPDSCNPEESMEEDFPADSLTMLPAESSSKIEDTQCLPVIDSVQSKAFEANSEPSLMLSVEDCTDDIKRTTSPIPEQSSPIQTHSVELPTTSPSGENLWTIERNKAIKITGKVEKKSKKSLSLEIKLKVLERCEAGEKAVDIGRALGLAPTTIRTIRDRDAAKIKESSQNAIVSIANRMTKYRSALMIKMESFLTIWINDQNQRGIPLSKKQIQVKAKSLFEELKYQPKYTSENSVTFEASNGWFERYKVRANLHNLSLKGEAKQLGDSHET